MGGPQNPGTEKKIDATSKAQKKAPNSNPSFDDQPKKNLGPGPQKNPDQIQPQERNVGQPNQQYGQKNVGPYPPQNPNMPIQGAKPIGGMNHPYNMQGIPPGYGNPQAPNVRMDMGPKLP